MRAVSAAALMIVLLPVIGCGPDNLTAAETLQALGETAQANQALTFASGTIEISTNFTIGEAVEAAADELRAFIESQLPCAEVNRDGAQLTVEYGALPGDCSFHGQTYSGSHSVEIVSAAAGQLQVHHEWSDLANARLSVSGSADVTWSGPDASRRVEHSLTWTNLENGEEVVGSGDRTHSILPGGLAEGIAIEGQRAWTSKRGDWDLSIDGVEMRWVDPVPQSGTYELQTPFDGKSASFTFERVDEDTIRVTVESGQAEFHFDVSKAGNISEE